MSNTIIIDVVPDQYQSVYTLSGIAAGTLIHIDCIYTTNTPLSILSATSQPAASAAGVPLLYAQRFDSESNDTNIWCRGSGKLAISLIPTV